MQSGPIEISVFGGFAVVRPDGESIRVPSSKGVALLSYLLVNAPRAQSRDRLIDLLWTDQAQPQGRANLRQALARIRTALRPAEDLVTSVGQSLLLDTADVASDVSRFESLTKSTEPDDWERALELYTGELLAGFHVDAPVFDEWLLAERQRYCDLAQSVARRLLAAKLEQGDPDTTIAVAHRMLTLDPFLECAHRALMKCHAERGRRDLALAHFEDMRVGLLQSLGVEPERETQELQELISEPRELPD